MTDNNSLAIGMPLFLSPKPAKIAYIVLLPIKIKKKFPPIKQITVVRG